MRHLVIGVGQIGTAVWGNLVSAKLDVTPLEKDEPLKGDYDVLHVCFPPSDSFVSDVKRYQVRFNAKCTIIYSSTPIGVTKQIPKAVHTPVEGVHPRLEYSIKTFKRWIGYNDLETAEIAKLIWEEITDVELVKNSDFTEFLKLASTSKYGINIVWAQYMADTAKQLGMEYKLVKDWDRSYNQLYTKMHLPHYRKYILDPPNGPIGGHCIVPNAEILDEQFPSDLLKMIKDLK